MTAEATQLRLRGLGEHAELIMPTYGVIVHGIPTNSINIKGQKTTAQQMLADNYTVVPTAEIPYIGWLTKEGAIIDRCGIHRPRNGQRRHLRWNGMEWSNTSMPALRPRLQSEAMLSLLQLWPHWHSMQRIPNLRLLCGAARVEAL